MKKVAVIMGSKSDLPIVSKTIAKLKEFGVSYEAHVMSAHRTPTQAAEFASTARDNGFGVVIAAAGKAAHLAGVLAGHTTLPVIGIPVKSSTFDGLDALLATVQMPSGVPVATTVPPLIATGPVKVAASTNVSTPAPVLTKPPAPLAGLLNVALKPAVSNVAFPVNSVWSALVHAAKEWIVAPPI